MARKVVWGFVVVATILFLVVAGQPASFAVERSAIIQAPPELVIDQIQNLRAMDAWSPWVKMDPKMTIAYDGPEAGVGARSAWEGPEIGRGRLEVTAVAPGREVEMRLEFFEPMQAINRVRFILDEGAEGTAVTWRMEGENDLLGKALSLVMDMDAMVGEEFAKGLASLETLVEAQVARR
jgi:hypothetical protein